MSLDMTFRQKLIRVGCSAAICGLSFSFIIGEIVDREAKLLRSWEADPALIPQSYLPLNPMAKAVDQWDSVVWREQLVASNSLITHPVPVNVSLETTKVATRSALLPAPNIGKVSGKVAVAPLASSKLSAQLEVSEAVRVVSAAPALRAEAELKRSEVEVILASIHSATRKLSQKGGLQQPAESSPEVSKSLATKVATHKPELGRAGNGLLASSRQVQAESTVATIVAPWVLNGKILATTSQAPEPGHYEIGLYSKIDPDGHPVGFPLPQQILPAGQMNFRLEVPAKIEKGYLFAEFISAKTGKRTLVMPPVNPWTRDMHQVAELYFRAEDRITSVVASGFAKEAAKEQWKIRGSVVTMFAGAGRIPQSDVVVKLRGRKESARTDQSGAFSLDLPKIKGTVFIEVLKAGYHPLIITVDSENTAPLQIEIASRHAIEQLSQRLGSNQSSSKGIFIGRAETHDGTGLRGMTAQLSLKADGPFYFDEEGVATRDLRQTSSNGRFMFLNVEAGTGFLEASLNGESITPLQVSTVEGGEMIQKDLVPVAGSLRGRAFNPVSEKGKMSQIAGARVRIDGASDWVTTDSFGAFSIGPLKWFKGERITLELTAEKFNNHRYQLSPDALTGAMNLFAFPAQYVSRLAHSMDVDLDPVAGVIIGKVNGPSVRVDALADHSTMNSARDFYFDANGRLRGSHEMTDPRFGTYVIFNVPKGRTLVHGNDANGQLRYSDGIVSGSASINVMME